MKAIKVHACEFPKGEIDLVTSKSVSNRALIIDFLTGQKSELKNLSQSDDTLVLQKLLQQLTDEKNNVLDVGLAGTVMRFLTTACCFASHKVILTGADRMKQRPVKELVECLRTLGAKINYLEKEGYPPLEIEPSRLKGGHVRIHAGTSSQFISSLMLCAPYFQEPLTLELEGPVVSSSYIAMTAKVMHDFGAETSSDGRLITVQNTPYKTIEYSVEADWSSASYFYSLAALSQQADVLLKGLRMDGMQGDQAIAEIAKLFGVDSHTEERGVRIIKKNTTIQPFHYDFTLCPDIAQTVAVMCAGSKLKGVQLKGLSTLVIKETDRIQALKNELSQFNVKATSLGNDTLHIDAGDFLTSQKAPVQTYHDHRMAMSFAPLAQKTGVILISDPLVVNKSYHNFWSDWNKLGCLTEIADI